MEVKVNFSPPMQESSQRGLFLGGVLGVALSSLIIASHYIPGESFDFSEVIPELIVFGISSCLVLLVFYSRWKGKKWHTLLKISSNELMINSLAGWYNDLSIPARRLRKVELVTGSLGYRGASGLPFLKVSVEASFDISNLSDCSEGIIGQGNESVGYILLHQSSPEPNKVLKKCRELIDTSG